MGQALHTTSCLTLSSQGPEGQVPSLCVEESAPKPSLKGRRGGEGPSSTLSAACTHRASVWQGHTAGGLLARHVPLCWALSVRLASFALPSLWCLIKPFLQAGD